MLQDNENPTLEETALAYLLWAHTEREEYFWAVELVTLAPFNQAWDFLWKIILELLRQTDENDNWSLSVIAAGPLEELLSHNGEAYVGIVIAESRENRKLLRALTGVWKHDMADEHWEKIRQVASSVDDPISDH